MNELLDRMLSEIEPEMEKQVIRWGGTVEDWKSNVGSLRQFIDERCEFLRKEGLECHGDLKNQFPVTLMTEPIGVGEIGFNTIAIQNFPWEGIYFAKPN